MWFLFEPEGKPVVPTLTALSTSVWFSTQTVPLEATTTDLSLTKMEWWITPCDLAGVPTGPAVKVAEQAVPAIGGGIATYTANWIVAQPESRYALFARAVRGSSTDSLSQTIFLLTLTDTLFRPGLGVTKDGSNRVSAWTNQGSVADANRDLLQASGLQQYLWTPSDANMGNRPTMLCDAVRADYMASGNYATPMPAVMTRLVVCRVVTIGSSTNSIIVGPNDVNPAHEVDFYAASGGPQIHAFAGFGGGGVDQAGPIIALPYPVVGIEVFDGASSRLYLNSQTPINCTLGTNQVFNMRTTGFPPATTTFGMTGSLATIAEVSGALSDTACKLRQVAFGFEHSIPIA